MQTQSGASDSNWRLACGFAAIFGAVLLGAVFWIAPQPASALPQYAAQTGLACGRCHVNPAGGGPRNAFGKAFAANGHKLPSKKK
jgi:hypothetical protein